MEVCVRRHDYFPEGSILSVRAGTVRRQAPLGSGRPFKFPGRLENPIKVDVYQPIASGYVVVRPGAQQYKVAWSNETGPLHCELEVKSSNGDSAIEVVGQTPRVDLEDSKQKADAAAQGAKEYLEQHQVLDFIQAVLQTVIKEKPEDPFKAMARHFLSGCNSTHELDNLQSTTMIPPPRTAPAPLIGVASPLMTATASYPTLPPRPPSMMPPGFAQAPLPQAQAFATPKPVATPQPPVPMGVALGVAVPQPTPAAKPAGTMPPVPLGSPSPQAFATPKPVAIPQPPVPMGVALGVAVPQPTPAGTMPPVPLGSPSPQAFATRPMGIAHECGYDAATQRLLGGMTPPVPPGIPPPQALATPQHPAAPPAAFPGMIPPAATGTAAFGHSAVAQPPPSGMMPPVPLGIPPPQALGPPPPVGEPPPLPATSPAPSSVTDEDGGLRESRPPVGEPSPLPATSPAPSSVMDEDSAGKLKQKLKETMGAAVTSGDLQKALQSIKAKRQSSNSSLQTAGTLPLSNPGEPFSEDACKRVEQLRLATKARLENAVLSGELSEALEQTQSLRDGAEQAEQAAVVSFTVENVEYKALVDSASLLSAFTSKVKDTIASESGVRACDVELNVFPGSVKVDATVRTLAATKIASVLSTSKTLPTKICESLKTISGIEQVTTDVITVGTIRVGTHDQSGKSLDSVKHIPTQQIRRDIVETLQRSYSSGGLLRALQKIRPKESSAEAPVPELRKALKDTLSRSASSGELSRALDHVAKSKAQNENPNHAMQARLRSVLEKSCISGELEQAFENLKSAPVSTGGDIQLRRALKDTLQSSCATGDLERAMAKVKSKDSTKTRQESSEDLRQALKDTLGRSVSSGKLETALSRVKVKKGDSTISCEESSEDLRQALKDTLGRSVSSGKLETALSRIKGKQGDLTMSCQESSEDLRQALKDTLGRSVSSGTLDAALSRVKGKRGIDEERRGLKDMLEMAAVSGELERALESSKPSQISKTSDKKNDARNMLKETLDRACVTGDLKHAVGKVKESRSAGQELRRSVQNTLSQSASSGEMFRVLENIKDSKSSNPDVRQMMRATLERSCLSGDLKDAVGKVKQSHLSGQLSAQNLREALKSTLSTSASSGDLGRALESIRDSKLSKSAASFGENSREEVAGNTKVMDMQHELGAKLQRSCTSGELQHALEIAKASMEPEELVVNESAERERLAVKDILERSCSTGELDRAVDRVLGSNGSQKIPIGGDVEDMREKLKDTLQRSCASGDLDRAAKSIRESKVQKSETEPTEDPRKRMKEEMIRRAHTGELSSALGRIRADTRTDDGVQAIGEADSSDFPKFHSPDRSRLRLKLLLQESQESGKLEEVLRRAKGNVEKDANEVRLKDSAPQDASTGKLRETIDEVAQSQHDEMRLALKNMLLESNENGELAKLMAALTREGRRLSDDEMKDAKELAIAALSSALVEPQAPSAREEEFVAAMRQRVRSLFQSAYEQGNLEEVLRSIVEGNPITDPAQARFEKESQLRGRVREIIHTACTDGSLNEALEANSKPDC